MYQVDELVEFPQWYIVERETEKIIKKLTTIKELSSYISNSDEFVRRLAILRINELRLKDALMLLKEVLDDSLETSPNKDLAAWTIQVISLHHNMDLFITNKTLSKFSGKESYNDICNISIKDSVLSPKFNFASSMFTSELLIENNDLRNTEDMDIDLHFSLKSWFNQYSKDIFKDLKNSVIKIPHILLMLSTKFFGMIFYGINICINLLRKTFKIVISKPGNKISKASFKKSISSEYENLNEKGMKSHYLDVKGLRSKYDNENDFRKYMSDSYKSEENFNYKLKDNIFKFFYFLFIPIRFIIQNKKIMFIPILLLYFYITFTTPGRVIAYKYMGIDIMQIQIHTYNKIKMTLTAGFNEIGNMIQGEQNQKNYENINDKLQAQNGEVILYKVSAKSGLNVRNNPGVNSEIVGKLNFNTMVYYRGEASQEAGKTWCNIESFDGIKGWVYSEFLEVAGGE